MPLTGMGAGDAPLVELPIFQKIETPYGFAVQSKNPFALEARIKVEEGASLYRIGTTGKSQAFEGQFWSLEHPSTPGLYVGSKIIQNFLISLAAAGKFSFLMLPMCYLRRV